MANPATTAEKTLEYFLIVLKNADINHDWHRVASDASLANANKA